MTHFDAEDYKTTRVILQEAYERKLPYHVKLAADYLALHCFYREDQVDLFEAKIEAFGKRIYRGKLKFHKWKYNRIKTELSKLRRGLIPPQDARPDFALFFAAEVEAIETPLEYSGLLKVV